MYLDGCQYIPPPEWEVEADARSRQYADTYREGCARGEPASCLLLAQSYEGGHGVARDEAAASALHARAVTLLDQACKAGDPEACRFQR